MVYMRARYYLPYLNRFLSPDTIVPDPTNPQSFNRFAYVLNSPTNAVDPTGHCYVSPESNEICGDNQSSPSPSPLPLPFDIDSIDITDTDSWPTDLKLLAMISVYEGGAQSDEQVLHIVWTILNRYNNPANETVPGWSRFESILLNPGQYHGAFGDPRLGYPGGVFSGELVGTGLISPQLIEER
jgi:hypothetical protein